MKKCMGEKRLHASLVLFTSFALLLLSGIGTLPVSAYPTLPGFQVTVLPDMPFGTAVKGRDLGFSFSFSGESVFLFGDTALSQANSEGKQWVVNTMYHTTDANGDDGIGGGYNFQTSGQPPVQWIPYSAAEVTYNASGPGVVGLWPMSVFNDPNTGKCYVWFLKVLETGTVPHVGTGFAQVNSLTGVCTRIQLRPGQTEDTLMFPTSEGLFGDMCVVTGGYLYTYYANGGDYYNTYLARAPLAGEAFKVRANWTFWNGSAWVTDVNAKANVYNIGSGTIYWNAYLNCWLFTGMRWVADRIVMRLADNLWGPWSGEYDICGAEHSSTDAMPYLARAHETLQKENGRIQYVCYSKVMESDFTERIPMVKVVFDPTSSPTPTRTPAPTQGNLSDITNLGGTASAQYTDSPTGEDIAKLIDNSSSTKYLTFHASGWVQFLANASYVVTKYTMTSANDSEERDPLTWTFQGSANGSAWITLDSRSGEDFTGRNLLKSYSFANSTAYAYYRLNMTNNSGTILQLAEWEIFGSSAVVSTSSPTRTATPTAPATSTPTLTATPTSTAAVISYNDNFNDNALSSAWTKFNGAWTETGTILQQSSAAQGDPCKAILSASGKTFGTNQTILSKVYVDSWTDGDSGRAGVSLFTHGTADGKGYNLLFHNNHSTVQWLDDGTAWGPSYTFTWTSKTWYWFKVKMENGTLYGRVWQDGVAEPVTWPYTWTRSGRSGFPALNGGTSGHGGSCTVFFDDVTITAP